MTPAKRSKPVKSRFFLENPGTKFKLNLKGLNEKTPREHPGTAYDPDFDYESLYFSRLGPRNPDFVPPKSPHRLLEETLHLDPWALFVSTIFLNVTSCRSARNKIFWFLSEHPDPGTVIRKDPRELERYFDGLGLKRTRAVQVWRMSEGYVKGGRSARELYGIGEYGEAAYRMFCLGDFGFVPRDRYLRVYREWYLKIGRYEDR